MQDEEKKITNVDTELLDESSFYDAKDNPILQSNLMKTQEAIDETGSKNDELKEHPISDDTKLKEEVSKIDNTKKYKNKYKQEYVDNNVILSVNHLKQYFFFGVGPKKFKLKAVHDVSFQVHEKGSIRYRRRIWMW